MTDTGDAELDLVHTERDVLLSYLDAMRDAVVDTLSGLSDEQIRQPGVASGTNLLGIVHHLTGVERHWCQAVFIGREIDVDKSMTAPVAATRGDVVAAYRRAAAESDAIVRACPDLATLARVPNPGEDQRDSLRAIVVHLIRETARHAGHADILREQIDGATEL